MYQRSQSGHDFKPSGEDLGILFYLVVIGCLAVWLTAVLQTGERAASMRRAALAVTIGGVVFLVSCRLLGEVVLALVDQRAH